MISHIHLLRGLIVEKLIVRDYLIEIRNAWLDYSILKRRVDTHRTKPAKVRRTVERENRQKLNRSLLAIYLAKNSSEEDNKIENLILSYLILAGKSESVYER